MLSTPDYKKYFISQYLKYNLDVGRYLTQSKLNR